MDHSIDKCNFTNALPDECWRDCSGPGRKDEAVAFWAKSPQIIPLFPSDESIRADLKEYGAWDDVELEDAEMNRVRYLWIASCDRREESGE